LIIAVIHTTYAVVKLLTPSSGILRAMHNITMDLPVGLQYSDTIQYLIDTPLAGLFSDNATNKDIPIGINYTINIITTYYTKGGLKLTYN